MAYLRPEYSLHISHFLIIPHLDLFSVPDSPLSLWFDIGLTLLTLILCCSLLALGAGMEREESKVAFVILVVLGQLRSCPSLWHNLEHNLSDTVT